MNIEQNALDAAATYGSITSYEVNRSRQEVLVEPPLTYAERQIQETYRLRNKIGKPVVNWSELSLNEVLIILKEEGACGGANPDGFHPGSATKTNLQLRENAKEACNGCPLEVQCLEYALVTNQTAGIWGGASERERKRIRKQRGNFKRRNAA